jgi:polar amino acid transport system substrate-binding protein
LVDQIVREAFEAAGHTVTYEIYPWKRAFLNVEKGTNDITYPWTFTDDREKVITFSRKPLIVNRSLFYYLKSTDFSWSEYSDLSKYTIGGMIGYSDTDLLEANGVKVENVKDELVNLKKLLAGRINTFAMNEVVGEQFIRENLSAEDQAKITKFEPKALVEENMHAVFSKNARGKMLEEEFNKGLQMLIDSGRYEEILFK